jgi:phosphatidyl-myo-inositol dimannoside synthase
MDVLCAPSRTTRRWREQFGRMLIEAMASGVAVVGSDSGEIPWVLDDAGMIVREADIEGWTQALRTLVDTPGLREDLGRRGLARARARFAWPVVAEAHLAFFEELLGQP